MHYIHKAFTMPPHVAVKKVAGRIKRMASETLMRGLDEKTSSYAKEYLSENLYSYFPKLSLGLLLPHAATITSVTKHYLDHRFDLLGSGWVQVKNGIRCRGLERHRYDMGSLIEADSEDKWLDDRINRSNLKESKRIWEFIAVGRSDSKTQGAKNRSYCPIDWHLDFKSGYRWPASAWYRDIRYGHKPGVDVKVPWELARMQHLPQLAFAYALADKSAIEEWRSDSDLTNPVKLKIKSGGNEQGAESENGNDAKAQVEALEQYTREFRSQVLDFIANNPPRFGVNWTCTMDVGIRVANWLVAYDLFRSYGAEFDEGFENVFIRSVYEHGLHIINNLEWSEELSSNHYLSDICGLLFVAAYLPGIPETDAWLAFAVQELIKEVENQFYPDGGNFEASTSYHRLSAEMVLYATALVLGLHDEKLHVLKHYDHTLIKVKSGLIPSPLSHYKLSGKNNQNLESPFPSWYFERLEKMAEFAMHITKPNKHIPQIGDNDSGRFFKFQPAYNNMTVAEAKKKYLNLEGYEDLHDDALYWDEDSLDHRHLVAAINGLFNRVDFAAFAGIGWLETDIVRDLAGGICLSSYKKVDEPTTAEQVHIAMSDSGWTEVIRKLESKPENQKQTMKIPLPDGAGDNLKLYAYPYFGLYIYRSKRLFLSIRCGPLGQSGIGSHAHNDQLSIELNVDGKDWIIDSGTYLYTPLPERRNEYRSVKAHFAPQVVGREPGDISIGAFVIGGDPKAEVISFGIHEFIGKHVGYGSPVYRRITIENAMVTVTDFFSDSGLTQCAYEKILFSPAYGVRCRESFC